MIICSVIITMTDEQQGFICDNPTELVEINPNPHYHIPCPPLPNNIRPPRLSLPLHQLTIHHNPSSISLQKQPNLVFNCHSRRTLTHQTDLSFSSSFESGNLQYATLQDGQYNCFMRADTNTGGHYQWFNFSVRNRSKKKVVFAIKNFNKRHMLYNNGLTPFAKSVKSGQKYQQITTSVRYEEEIDQDQNVRFCLRFKYYFEYQNDEVYFCSQPPYTYQQLTHYLGQHSTLKNIQIATTVMGHPVSALLLNDPQNSKALIVVIARQHPGQSVGSWMMQGYLGKLISMTERQGEKYKDICWLIIPMVNIDGVMLGNNRTGLLGYDFNRHWNCDEDSLKESLFPELTGILKYFKKGRRQRKNKVRMFLDLHGHSSEPNVFTYGPPFPRNSEYFEPSRLFPYLMSKSHPAFKLNQCSYEIALQKRFCSRSIFHSKLGFPYSYTVQSSFGIYNGKQITEMDLVKVGQSLCECSLDFVSVLTEEVSLRLKICQMKRECGQEMGSHGKEYDSDSDQNEPLPSFTLNLPMKSLFKKDKKNKFKGIFRKNTEPEPQLPKQIRSSKSGINGSQLTIGKNNKLMRHRFLTDCRSSTKKKNVSTGRKESLRFPYLSRKKLPPEDSTESLPSRLKSLKKVKADSQECPLFKNEVRKVGKGVFIFNGYSEI